jgi:hypothetical protein
MRPIVKSAVGLSSADPCNQIPLQFFASGHKLASPDIRHDNPSTGAQSPATGSPCRRVHPFPTLSGFRAEPPVAKEPKFAAFRVEYLDPGEVGVYEGQGGIKDLLVESVHPSGGYQLRSDLLKALCGFNLHRTQLFAPTQRLMSRFQFPGVLPPDPAPPDSMLFRVYR